MSVNVKEKIEFIRQTFGFSIEDIATQLHTIEPEVNSMLRDIIPSEKISRRLDWLYGISLCVDKMKIAKLGQLVHLPLSEDQSMFYYMWQGSFHWHWAAHELKAISLKQAAIRFERKGTMNRPLEEAEW